MGRSSIKVNKNIYQLAREAMGYTRAEAAAKMGNDPSENRITRIEGGADATPYDVCKMSVCYNKPELRNYFCTNECHIGNVYVPKVEFNSNIHEILVNMLVSLDNVNSNRARLMEILADGEISKDEIMDFKRIQNELEKISVTVDALQLWIEKMNID